jgi:hypothetical protein
MLVCNRLSQKTNKPKVTKKPKKPPTFTTLFCLSSIQYFFFYRKGAIVAFFKNR